MRLAFTLPLLVPLSLLTGPAAALVLDFDVTGIESIGTRSNPNNVVETWDLAAAMGRPAGSPVTILGVGFDVTLDANFPSTPAEMGVNLNGQLDVFPAGSNPAAIVPGGSVPVDSGGILNISDITIPNGALDLTFFENNVDDIPGGADGEWSGTVRVDAIPEPDPSLGIGLMGLVVLATALARRRLGIRPTSGHGRGDGGTHA
jgi:MYXO-CTERM domain-containing protein